MIISKCPLRISLAGGSTDLQSFVDKNGRGSVINFSTNLYTYATLHDDKFGFSSEDKKFIVNYTKREECSEIDEIKNELVRECFKYFSVEPNTSSLTSDVFSSGSGLASSSSYLISFLKALALKHSINFPADTLCELAVNIERKFNPLTGFQDPYGCGISGLKRIDITSPNQVSIKALSNNIFKKIKMHILHTGIRRQSTNILKTLDISKASKILPLVDEMEECINKECVTGFVSIIKRGWREKKKLSKEIASNNKIKKMDNQLENHPDVLAHRLCGAGNGGFFLIFSKKENVNIDNKALKITIDNTGPTAHLI